MPSPGPGSYDPEYISFDDYMPKTLRHSKTGNGQGRMTAEQAQKAEARRQFEAQKKEAKLLEELRLRELGSLSLQKTLQSELKGFR